MALTSSALQNQPPVKMPRALTLIYINISYILYTLNSPLTAPDMGTLPDLLS